MPMPKEYRTASQDLDRFLRDLIEVSGLTTVNQAYSMTRSVLHVFRRHTDVAEAIRFANAIPPLLRAIFLEGWDTHQAITPFPDRSTLTGEVRAVREAHNFATENAIAEVALTLRRHVDPREFERTLSGLAPAARAYWAIDD